MKLYPYTKNKKSKSSDSDVVLKKGTVLYTHRHVKISSYSHWIRRIVSKWKIIVATWAVCLFLYGAYYLLIKSNYFLISDIKINGSGGYINDRDIQTVVGSAIHGKNILTTNQTSVKNMILSTFQGVSDVEIKKILPNKVVITVKPRSATAIILVDPQKKYFVDQFGYVMGEAPLDSANLPIINYDGEVLVGKFLDANTIPVSMDIINSADEHQIAVSSISVSSRYAAMTVDGNIEVYLSMEKNIKKMIEELSLILKTLSIEGKRIKTVDLRYDKRIVSYE